MENWQTAGFGLYLHWPFCQSKCPYCDFNSHVAGTIDQSLWQSAYLREIDRIGQQTQGRVLRSIFFGGGTPSLMDPTLVGAILDRIRATWTLSNDVEITLEANPSSVEMSRFRGYAAAGVNRVSLGVQALDDGDLRRLGRLHSVAVARTAIEVAQSVFSRVSVDLIYARQDQSLAAWQRELETAISLGTDHLSLYQLTIEDGTVFGDMHAKRLLRGLPGEDLTADMFDLTRQQCASANLTAYEVSNHAVAGAESRHNLIYWRMGDYAGIGPGAHGRLTLSRQRYATEAVRAPSAWLDSVRDTGSGELPRQLLTATGQAEEYLMMSLRLAEGSSLARYRDLAGGDLADDGIREMVDLGLIVRDGEQITASAAGVLVLNGVLRRLLAGRQSGD